MARCKNCGSKLLFFVDETSSYLEINGDIVKQVGGGDLHNRNCIRCTYPEQYEEYKYLDEMQCNSHKISKGGLLKKRINRPNINCPERYLI